MQLGLKTNWYLSVFNTPFPYPMAITPSKRCCLPPRATPHSSESAIARIFLYGVAATLL